VTIASPSSLGSASLTTRSPFGAEANPPARDSVRAGPDGGGTASEGEGEALSFEEKDPLA
jgi:hypothetical protein